MGFIITYKLCNLVRIELGLYLAIQEYRLNHCMCGIPRIRITTEVVHVVCAWATVNWTNQCAILGRKSCWDSTDVKLKGELKDRVYQLQTLGPSMTELRRQASVKCEGLRHPIWQRESGSHTQCTSSSPVCRLCMDLKWTRTAEVQFDNWKWGSMQIWSCLRVES